MMTFVLFSCMFTLLRLWVCSANCQISNHFFIAKKIYLLILIKNFEFVPTNRRIADCKSRKRFDDSIWTIPSHQIVGAIWTLQIISANRQIVVSSDTWNIIWTGFRELRIFFRWYFFGQWMFTEQKSTITTIHKYSYYHLPTNSK